MTDAEIKVWHLFIEEIANSVEKDFTANDSKYRNNIAIALIMLENIVKTNGLSWKLKLKSQSSYGIPYNSVDEFVDVMTFNAIRKMKTLLFE
jgi:hypothetical protein